ncbi:MAG: hypothetical protein AAF604_04495 [Acidobacteriota bacterium]
MIVERAKRWAGILHAGQVDKAGLPIFDHVQRVGVRVGALLWRAGRPRMEVREAEIAGFLHDAIEDTVATHPMIDALFGRRVAAAVLILSRDDSIAYSEYIDQVFVRGGLMAQLVKFVDMEDNLREPVPNSLRRRYADHLPQLAEACRRSGFEIEPGTSQVLDEILGRSA